MDLLIEVELKSIVLSTAENCLQLLASGLEDVEETVIIRVESLLQALLEFDNGHAAWLDNVIQLLEKITSMANYGEGELVDITSRGRPRNTVQMSSIEFLLTQRFSVPKISRMLRVSTATIFRRLREHGILVNIIRNVW